jgi:hypothetical protein
MEYHIMVFQTLCKHFALPAISQKRGFLAVEACSGRSGNETIVGAGLPAMTAAHPESMYQ